MVQTPIAERYKVRLSCKQLLGPCLARMQSHLDQFCLSVRPEGIRVIWIGYGLGLSGSDQV